MSSVSACTSPQIAREMARVFGNEVRTFSVKMKHRREVGNFIRKIEGAHKRAGKSKLVFGG